MKPLQKGFYEIPTEEQMDEKLEKRQMKSDKKWKRVDYSFVESKLKGQYLICSMRLGQSSKYKLAPTCTGLWNPIGPPSASSWEYAKDENGTEYIRMCRFGSAISNVVKLMKK